MPAGPRAPAVHAGGPRPIPAAVGPHPERVDHVRDAADLNEATLQALDHMLTLLETEYEVARPEALALASLLVDLRVTQVANGVHGVHALLPLDALRR